jgi:hypothetical protein
MFQFRVGIASLFMLLVGVLAMPALAQQGATATSVPLSAAAAISSSAAATTLPRYESPVFDRLLRGGPQDQGADLFHWNGLRIGTLNGSAPNRLGILERSPSAAASSDVGVFAEYALGSWKISANARQDLASGRASAPAFAVGFGYGAKIASDVSVAVGPSVTIGNGRTGNDVLGIAPTGAGGGRGGVALQDVGASVALNWRFLDSWNFTGFAGARQLVADPNESEQGAATQYFTGFALGYHF